MATQLITSLSLYFPTSTPTATSINLHSTLSPFPTISFSPSLTLKAQKPNTIFCSSSSATLTAELKETTPSPSEVKEEEVEYSKTRLFAHNFPYETTSDDIKALFEKHGTVLDIEMSMFNKHKSRGLAFMEMGSVEEAANALAKLNETEFQGRIIKVNYAKPKEQKQVPPKPPVTYNLFVANISFTANANDLREFFKSGGANIFSAQMVYHTNPRKRAGYGFVSFRTEKDADEALKNFDGKELMGRPIRVYRSERFTKPVAEKKTNTKDDFANDSDLELEESEEAGKLWFEE